MVERADKYESAWRGARVVIQRLCYSRWTTRSFYSCIPCSWTYTQLAICICVCLLTVMTTIVINDNTNSSMIAPSSRSSCRLPIPFAARCHYGAQFVIDKRKLIGHIVSVHRLVLFLSDYVGAYHFFDQPVHFMQIGPTVFS